MTFPENSTSLRFFWNLPKEDALSLLAVTEDGLSQTVAGERIKEYGLNTIKSHSGASSFRLFGAQFKSPITVLLIIAALLSLALGDITNAVIILLIILMGSLLGFWQEKGAVNAVNELLKMVQILSTVRRDSKAMELPVKELVPGDIILLNAGDIIPADCLLLESKDLFIDEAAFTGETFPVEKSTGIVASDAPLAKRRNSVFMGAHVISGEARALVVHTGLQTELGKIAAQLHIKTPETEFERGVRRFGYMLMEITLMLVIIILATNTLLHKPPLNSILFSLALAVGLTPQLLPAIISINLSVGARAMARKQVIVKRLSSIEDFGSMNILCSDKTGTITEGKVIVKDALDMEGNHSEKVLRYAWLNASLQQGFDNPVDEAIKAVMKDNQEEYMLQSEVPYDFSRKRLTIQVKHEGETIIITKGALNAIISICDRVETAGGRQVGINDQVVAINKEYEKWSVAGYRVLGIAYAKWNNEKYITCADEINMIFLGFIILFDPPKKDVKQTILDLRKLGVQLKLITGDNALVAKSLAIQIGFDDPVILTGQQLQQMNDISLQQQVMRTTIFAEVEPGQKERIIRSFKKSGNVIGFLGDGINDAPALHAADVGISVDSAVDVAKEAADIVLLQQGLDVLSAGIIAGRKTFANTMKYIFIAASANFGNMLSMAGASLFLPFLPLLPKQILLGNLLADFPEMAIATDRVDDSSIVVPHRWNLRFIKRFMIVFGVLSTVFDYLTFAILLYGMNANEQTFQTGWFIESLVSATVIVLVIRTRLPFFKSPPGKSLVIANLIVIAFALLLPSLPFAGLLGFTSVPLYFYGWMLLIVIVYAFSAELIKHIFFRKDGDTAKPLT